MGIVYRSFFAIRNLSRSDGVPTNALFGFIRALNQVRARMTPTHWVVVFDGGLPSERTVRLPEYKAQRPHMPDDMRVQLPYINRYLEAAGVPSLLRDACEADDLIASLVARHAADVDGVVILSSDKDMYQLVSDKVRVTRSGTGEDAMGPAEVEAKTGVRPEQVVEWLALVGDAADNIGGVPGVGGKTASRLLKAYGTIDGLWAHLGELGEGRVATSLAASRAIVERNLSVVRLTSDLADLPTLTELAVQPEPTSRVVAFYEEMEFHALARAARSPELSLGG